MISLKRCGIRLVERNLSVIRVAILWRLLVCVCVCACAVVFVVLGLFSCEAIDLCQLIFTMFKFNDELVIFIESMARTNIESH